MSEDLQILKIKGKLMWPKLFKPDTYFEPRWTVDLLLNEEGKKKAKEETLRVKVNDKYKGLFDGYDGSFIRIERPVTDRKGEERDPPVVKDAKLRDVPSTVGIGNGTDAIARFFVKTRNKQGKIMSPAEAMKSNDGYGMFLTGVQIINLVPYENTSDPETDFIEEDGSFSTGGDGGFDFEKGDEPFDKSDSTILAAG